MEYKIPLWEHQKLAVERAKLLPYFALFFMMGTGKSATVINILRQKINDGKKPLKTIVFAPPVVLRNWKEEFLMHSKIGQADIQILSGHGKKRAEQFMALTEGAKSQTVKQPIIITNYESLLIENLYPLFKNWQPDVLIFDESHKLKNYTAKRSKLAERLANPKVGPRPLVYLLSGTPVLNSPMDLFFQYLILDGGETFGKNFFIFRAKYFIDKNAGMNKQNYFPDWRVRSGALEEINQRIFDHGMRVTKEECMDLPEELSVTIKCEMTKAQAKNYQELKKDLVTSVRNETIMTPLAIVKALRLMQIASGYLPLPMDESGEIPKEIYEDTDKDEKFRGLLEELAPHKVAVWAVFKQNYESIKKVVSALGYKFVEVHGGISRAEQDANIKAFQEDPEVKVFIGHPGSAGIGVNLVCAHYDIFYSRTFSLEHYLQARARLHRGGQTQKVTHYDLICEGTIEEIVQKKLANKEELGEKLLASLVSELEKQ